jgi:hypothetical protein
VVSRNRYAGELPKEGDRRYVRLYGVVRAVSVSVFDERLVRELGGTISARFEDGSNVGDQALGTYRNFAPDELKRSPKDFPPLPEPVPEPTAEDGRPRPSAKGVARARRP